MSRYKLSKLQSQYQVVKLDLVKSKKNNPNQIIRHTVKEYYNKNNWSALINYLCLLDEKDQLPYAWKWQIGQMYIYLNHIKMGLDYLYDMHYKDPKNPDIQLAIMHALNKYGQSVYSFNWIKKPKINNIDRDILNSCLQKIQTKENAIPLFLLYSLISEPGKSSFDEFDLLLALKKDKRFYVFNDTCFFRYSKINNNENIIT